MIRTQSQGMDGHGDKLNDILGLLNPHGADVMASLASLRGLILSPFPYLTNYTDELAELKRFLAELLGRLAGRTPQPRRRPVVRVNAATLPQIARLLSLVQAQLGNISSALHLLKQQPELTRLLMGSPTSTTPSTSSSRWSRRPSPDVAAAAEAAAGGAEPLGRDARSSASSSPRR